jgi:hypothetical protein
LKYFHFIFARPCEFNFEPANINRNSILPEWRQRIFVMKRGKEIKPSVAQMRDHIVGLINEYDIDCRWQKTGKAYAFWKFKEI